MGIIKKILSRYFPAVPVGAVLASVMFSHSCANTTTPPSGGPKDTLPPVIVKLYPPDGATMVPVHKTQLSFTFDEYVVAQDTAFVHIR